MDEEEDKNRWHLQLPCDLFRAFLHIQATEQSVRFCGSGSVVSFLKTYRNKTPTHQRFSIETLFHLSPCFTDCFLPREGLVTVDRFPSPSDSNSSPEGVTPLSGLTRIVVNTREAETGSGREVDKTALDGRTGSREGEERAWWEEKAQQSVLRSVGRGDSEAT